MTLYRVVSSFVVSASLLSAATLARAQVMPDPKEIAGVPLPVSDVAAGTVTVRVIRGSLSNNLPGQAVELLVDGEPRRKTTGESGRAEFTGLATGSRVKAVAVVGGERLESQEFAVPSAGGTRVLLVATDPEAEKRAAEDGIHSQNYRIWETYRDLEAIKLKLTAAFSSGGEAKEMESFGVSLEENLWRDRRIRGLINCSASRCHHSFDGG